MHRIIAQRKESMVRGNMYIQLSIIIVVKFEVSRSSEVVPSFF